MNTHNVKMGALFAALLLVTAVEGAKASLPELKPEFTPENGQSCGRTKAFSTGVACDAPQCYDTQVSREFTDWASFENNFLREEMKRSGLLAAPSDFSDLCPAYKQFSADERELFWLDFLKLMAGFESSYLWLSSYDDLVGGKIVTERGFFQVAKSDCEGLPEVQRDYCATHWPRTNAKCALRIITSLVKGRRGKSLDAIAAHWGSMRSAGRNSEGGRRQQLQKTFSQQPACKLTGTPAPQGRGRGRKGRQAEPPSAPNQVARIQYERLQPKMYPDEDFIKAPIQPSYMPRAGAADACNQDMSVPAIKAQCRRFLDGKHYQQVDSEWADKHPQ